MNTKGVKAASFPAAFPAFCHPRRGPNPTQCSGVANGRPQTLHQRRCRSQFCKPVRFSPSLAAQAAAAPRSRHSTAVSLHMVPFHFGPDPALQPPAANPIRLPRTSLSHPETLIQLVFAKCSHCLILCASRISCAFKFCKKILLPPYLSASKGNNAMNNKDKPKKAFTDEEILDALKSYDRRRVHEALKYLWLDKELVNSVKNLLSYKGFDAETETDFWLNDALAEFDRQVKSGKYDTSQSGIKTYIVAIVWKSSASQRRTEKRRTEKNKLLTDSTNSVLRDATVDPEAEFMSQEKIEAIKKAISGLTPRCRKIITLKALHYKNEEIAEEMGYNNKDTVREAVGDCRRMLRTYLANHPALSKIINEK